MKVKELMERLEFMDGEREVVLARDPNGNGYHALDDLGAAAWIEEDGGRIGFESLDELTENDAQEYGEDVLEDGAPAVVLWPKR
jgi:hypothetical protein